MGLGCLPRRESRKDDDADDDDDDKDDKNGDDMHIDTSFVL